MPRSQSAKSLKAKARRGFRGYPIITVAFYGPDDRRATKVAIGIVRDESQEEADIVDRFHADRADVRVDERINKRILDLVRENGGRSVIMTDGIIGCPHEEGVDYPEGEECPECPFWHGRDRFAGEPSGGPSAERSAALARMLFDDSPPSGTTGNRKPRGPEPEDRSQ